MPRWLDSLLLLLLLLPFLRFSAAHSPGPDDAADTPPPLTRFAWDNAGPVDAGGLSLDELHAENPEVAVFELDSKVRVNPLEGVDAPANPSAPYNGLFRINGSW
ncbi:uncharacterized protein A4U43_C02F21900 [Asparagus officinalis]|uniref:Uncharacterized protein n=1 Tax=Asparagus officinalis TaxID=4686 RepID=A0A5P1FMU3_ASPOF|nr:uncharacterized protein A4U43_C02F21900 [Asparagus officinalis]